MTYEPLSIAEAKQIAGRAGRYRTAAQAIKQDQAAKLAPPSMEASNLDLVGADTAAQNAKTDNNVSSTPPPSSETPSTPPPPQEQTVGLVTTLDKLDYPIIERAMGSDPEPLPSAGIQPPAYIVERFARFYPAGTPFAYLLIRLSELAKTSGRFHLCDLRTQISIADAIQGVEGLTTTDKLILVSSPIEPRKGETALACTYAEMIAQNKSVSIDEVQELDLELLNDEYTANRGYLNRLERLHKGVIVWMWLSYRFDGVFIKRELAAHVKELVEKRIEDVLARMSFDFDNMKKRREQAIQEMLENEAKSAAEAGSQQKEGQEADVFENMPDTTDEKAMKEWLKELAAKETEAGLELPSSDLVPRQQKEDDEVQLSAGEVLDAGEPAGAVADETLLDEMSDRRDSMSPENEKDELNTQADNNDNRQKSSSPSYPFPLPPTASSSPSSESQPINSDQ